MHQFVGRDEFAQGFALVARRDAGMTEHAEPHGPQQVGHQVRHRRFGIDHRHVHVAGRRSHSVGTHEIDFDLRGRALEIPEDRHREMHGEARRHLHPQRPDAGGILIADIVEGVLQAIERFHHGRQQQLSGFRQDQCVRAALEQLRADQLFERDDMPRQGALGYQQRIGGGGEAQVLGNAFEGAQRVQGQPSTVDIDLCHTTLQGDHARVYAIALF